MIWFSHQGKVVRKDNKTRVQGQVQESLQERTDSENGHPKLSITDAVALAVLTVFSYVFHYFFEYGYLSYFNIPAAFISFNLSEMIPAIFFLVFAYAIFGFILWPYINRLLRALPGFFKWLLIFSPWFLIFIYMGFSWEIFLFFFAGILLSWGSEKIRKDRFHDPGIDPLIAAIIPKGNRFLLLYFLLTAIASSIAFGRIAAVTRTSFPVSDTTNRCVVVYTTADSLICKPIDINNEFENTFNILNLEEYQNIELRYENVGQLRPKRILAIEK